MGAFHQLGHDSQNLVGDPLVGEFSGAILSPVNYSEEDSTAQVKKWQTNDFECILDPQLYVPTSSRGKLQDWGHFPSDVDTADISSLDWWKKVNSQLVDANLRVGAKTVASPCQLPRSGAFDFYALATDIGDDLNQQADGRFSVLQTVPVFLDELGSDEYTKQLVSVISRTSCDGFYLVLKTDVVGRQALAKGEQLGEFGRIIALLTEMNLRTVIGYCGVDLVLWKAAGASDCATGKFWNLRRFSPERWLDVEEGGGGQLPYWLEPSLLAHLRQPDMLRLKAGGLLPPSSCTSPPSTKILQQIANKPETAWVALSWRQYLNWFATYEASPNHEFPTVDSYLKSIESNWTNVEAADILFEEKHNDGSWIRQWRIATRRF